MTKTGILLVAFGASNTQAHTTLKLFDDYIRDRFKGVNVRWAFTSELIRDHLAAKRMKTDSVRKALEKMWWEKYTHVALQSLHTIPGAEYEDLLEDAAAMTGDGKLMRVSVGTPLLHTDSDVERTARVLLEHLPATRKPEDAVVCMGHGTKHAGESRYQDLAQAVRAQDANVHLGTMDGTYTLEHIIPHLHTAEIRRVWLLPFLSMVGRHAREDMAGDTADSWKSRILAEGFDCRPVLKGTAEYSGFVSVWSDHLSEALSALSV